MVGLGVSEVEGLDRGVWIDGIVQGWVVEVEGFAFGYRGGVDWALIFAME